MKKAFQRRELIAIPASILFLALGYLAVWLSQNFLGLNSDAILISLLVLPIFMYLILSGRLLELRTPGGLEAKFADVASDSLDLDTETVEPALDQLQMVSKGSPRELQSKLYRVDESRPLIMTLNMGRGGYYDRDAWIEYAEGMSQFQSFKFVVFLDQDNRFLAYMPSWALLQLLKMPALGNEFVDIVNRDDIQELRRYPGVMTGTISINAKNMDALREMNTRNVEALVVIDNDRKVKGVVERDRLLSRLLLAMAG